MTIGFPVKIGFSKKRKVFRSKNSPLYSGAHPVILKNGQKRNDYEVGKIHDCDHDRR